MAANEEGKNTPQDFPFNDLLEGDPKKSKKIDLQQVDILSGTPTLAEPNIDNILPGSPIFALELAKAYPRELQRYADELKPDQWQLGTDWEQSMAANQSRATKYGRGLVNMSRTFYNTALETIASPFAIGPEAWNSPFWRDLDKAKQDYKEDFPIYKPEGYDDMGFFPRAGTAAFWADEFTEGIGFFTGAMAGSIISGVGYGGGLRTLLNPRLVANIARGGRLSLFRGLAKGGVKGADDVYRGISRSIFTKDGIKNLAQQAKTSLGKSNLLMTSLFAARSEAAVEARDVVKSTYEALERRYVEENNLSSVSEIPGVVRSRLYNTAIGLGNHAFTNNFALLTVTNMATFKLLGIAGNVGTRSIGSSMIGRYLNTPVKGGITRLQSITGLGARGARNLRRAGRLGQGMFIESIGQEYPQYVIQDASVNYAVDKHFEGSTKSLSEYYLHSAQNAFSDPHGQTAIALGALISAFAMGGGAIGGRVFKNYSTQGQKIEANIEELLELVRAGKFVERQQQTDNMNIVEKNMLEAQTLWEQGENKLAQNARDRAVAAYVAQLMQFEGGINNMTATLDEIEQDLTDEQFAEMVGQPLESLVDENGKISIETKQKYTSALKDKAKTLADIYKDIQVAFPSLATPNRLQAAIANEAQTEEYKEEVAIREYLKNELYYTLAGSYLSEEAGNELLDALEESTGVNKDTLQKELDSIVEEISVYLTEEGRPGQPADERAFQRAIEAKNKQLNDLITSNQNVNRRDRKGRFTANSDTFLELAADYMMHRLNANHAVELYNELVGDNQSNRQKLRAEAAQQAKEAEEASKKYEEESLQHILKTAVTPADLDGVKGSDKKSKRAVSRRRKELTRQQKELYKQFDSATDPEELRDNLKRNRNDQKQAEIDAAYSYWSSSKRRTAAAENQNNAPKVDPNGKKVEPETSTPATSTSAETLKKQARQAATEEVGKKGKGKTVKLPRLTEEQKKKQKEIQEANTPKLAPTAADLVDEIEGGPQLEPEIETPSLAPEEETPGVEPKVIERSKKEKSLDKRVNYSKKDYDSKSLKDKAKAIAKLLNSMSRTSATLLEEDRAWLEARKEELENEGYIFDGEIGKTLSENDIYDAQIMNLDENLPDGVQVVHSIVAPKQMVNGKLVSRPVYDVRVGTGKIKDRADLVQKKEDAEALVKKLLAEKIDTKSEEFTNALEALREASAAVQAWDKENLPKSFTLAEKEKAAPTQKAPTQTSAPFDGTIETTRGQYEFADRENPKEGIVFVDNNDGTYSPKPFFDHPEPVRYEELSDPNLKEGDNLEIVLDEGATFFELNRKKFSEKDLKNWQFAPMYLRNPKTGKRVSLLQMDVVIKEGEIVETGANPIREQIYNTLQKRNKVTVQIIEKKFNKGNILNAKTQDGTRIESKLQDVFANTYTIDRLGNAVPTENAPIPLIFTTYQDGVTGFIKLTEENSPSEMTPNHIAKVNAALDSVSDIAYPGVVYTAVVTPDGDVTVIPLSTAFLNEAAVEEVVDLIKEGKHGEISNIVGLQVAGEVFAPGSNAQEDIKEYLLFEPETDPNNNDYIYRFRLPQLEGGQVIKMYGKQMSNMLKGIKFSYVIEAPLWNSTYGQVDYKAASEPAFVTEPDAKKEFQDSFKDLLRNKRYQVAKETANRPEQFNELTQNSLGRNARKNVTEGSADTILTTNVYNNNGSLFFDVTLTVGNPTVTSRNAKGKTSTKKIKPSASSNSKTAPAPNPNEIIGLGNVPEDTRGNVFGAKPKPTQQSKPQKITKEYLDTLTDDQLYDLYVAQGYPDVGILFYEGVQRGIVPPFRLVRELPTNIQQDSNSYYRGQVEEPTIDSQGNLILYAKDDPLYKKAGLPSVGVSMTTDLQSAIEYGEGQFLREQLLFDDRWGYDINTWEAEDAWIKLGETGYFIIQIPKNIKNEIVKEAGEVKVLGDKIIVPKGKYVIDQITEFSAPREEVTQRIEKEKAVEYLESRFPGFGVNIFDKAVLIGDGVAHGWFENMAFHVWANAEIGSEYHEAFHGMFRMFLTDKQRAALYKEAEEKFSEEDIQNEVSKLKGVYSKLDAQDLRNLALEELMAEGFRNYRLTEGLDEGGFKKAIVNFFKDLYTFIKALVTEKVTMDEVFRIADARRGSMLGVVKNRMFRNSGKFVSTNVAANRAFMYMEGFGSKAQKMVVDTIATQFMDLSESREETDGLLNKSDEDSIPVWWLRHSFRDNQGNPLEASLAIELAEVIESNDSERAAEILKENPIIDPNTFLSLPDRDDSGNPLQFDNDAATKKQLAGVFYQVYKNWDTKIEDNTGNVIQQGWVEALKTRMSAQALRIKAVTELLEVEELEDQDNSVLIKIYDKPQIETDPTLEGTAALRPLFNKFKKIDPNFLGYRTMMTPKEVMAEVQTYLSDTLSFSEGLANMLSAAQFRPEIREIVDVIKAMPAETQAKIDYHLRLGYNKLMMIDVTEDGTKFYASNQGSVANSKITDWKRASRRLPKSFVSDYLYDVTIDPETNAHILSVSDDKAKRIVKQYNEAVKGILNQRKGGIDPVTDSSKNISSPVKALSDMLWGMGIKIMDSKQSSEQALQTYINVGVKEFRGDDVYTMQGRELFSELINQNQNGLVLLVKKIANVKASGLVLVDENVTAKENQIDIFDEHRRLLGEFAKISKMFNKPKSESFIAASGKKVFPNNKYTFLGKHVLRLSTDSKYFRDTVDMYMADPAFNPNGTDQLMSLTFRVLTDPAYGESIRANFERTMYDGYKKKFESVAKTDYKNQDEFQSLEIRLHHFINAGNSKYTRIAVPTQAGRGRLDFIQVPRLNTMEKNFGIKYDRSAEIRAIILQDLARIAQAEDFMQNNSENDYDEVYHAREKYKTMSFEFLELPEDENGENPSAYVEEYLESFTLNTDPTGNIAFVEKFLQDAEKQVEEFIKKSEKKVAAHIAKGGITQRNLNFDYQKSLGIKNLGDLITQFVEHDLLWQSVEFAKVFANGIYNYKNTEDFYKRMSTITTPVYQLAVKGTLPSDPNFGMPQQFTKAVLSDVELGMEIRDAIQHAADLQTIVSELQSQTDNLLVTPEKIQAIAESYQAGRDEDGNPIVNKTDATGIISVEFRKAIMQVRREWTDSHEEAYQNDLKPGGRFVDNSGVVPALLPQKPFMREAALKDGRVQQFIGKNSFITLTKELASTTPVLMDIYNRMNATGPYSNLQKIQVINMDSAEKASRSGIHTLYAENGKYVQGQLKGISTVTHQSDSLGIGQEIRDKEKEEVTINRQFRKGLMSIVIPAEDYVVNGYLEDKSKRLDLKGSELINLLQATNVEIARRNFNNFLNKSGLRGVANNKRQTAEDRLQTLKQLRSSFYGQLQDLNSLYLTAMDIVPSDIGGYSYRLPMSYPPIANKMGQLFFSGFNKAAHKAKTRGVEAVQVSELGGTERDGELRFLRVEEDKAGNVAVAHAEVDIKRSVAMKMGMENDEDGRFLIAYRVPNQGPSSTIILKIRNFLPESHPKAVRVPGPITTQSGSDFDIDKLFVLFPELDANGDKIFPNVDTLKRTGFKIKDLQRALRDKSISDAMLKNLIIDLNTAIYANPVHLIETMEPLDAGLKLMKDTLDEVETILAEEGKELAPTLSINDPLTPINVEVMNKTGVIGRGLKANALAGLQTAIGSNITVASTHAPRVRREDGAVLMLDTVVQRDYTGTQTTGRNISLGLNRAVDSEKTPAELYKLNEHPFNSTVVSFLQSFGVPERESYMLLQMPAVRNVSEKYRISGRGVDSMKGIVESELKKYIPKADKSTLEQDPIPLDFEEMRDMLIVTDDNKSMQGAYLITYYKHFMAADAHRKVNSAITPDTLERVNEPAGINAYFDFVDNVLYKTEEDKLVFGAENVLEGDLYPLQKKYYENMVRAAELSTNFGFVEFTQAAQKLKQDIRHMLNYEALDVDQHRLIDRAVYTILMSDVQSPFHWVYQRGYVEELMMGDNNISYRLEQMKEKYPRLMNNEFFRRLSPHPTNTNPDNKVFPIVFENMEDYDGDLRDEIETDSYRLYFEPQEYVDTVAAQNEVREFMKDVVANAFLNGGFFKSPFSYFDMIHYDVQEAVSEPITVDDTVLNITNFFEAKFRKLATNQDELNQMSHEVIRSLGKFKAGKRSLAPSISVKAKEVAGGVLKVTVFKGLYNENMGFPRYIVADIKGADREARLMRLRGFDTKNSAIYDMINEKSEQFKLLELGIRDETGQMISRSLINEEGTTELANMSQNVINKKKAKTVEQELDPRKICIKL